MTPVAQRNQVIKLVSLFVACYSKLSERLDMMHVKLYAQINFSDTTAATGIAVALARLSALLSPVWAIVLYVTTFPVDVQHTAFCGDKPFVWNMFSLPARRTFAATKHAFTFAEHCRWDCFKFLTALLAYTLYSASTACGDMSWCVIFLPITKAAQRTKMRSLPLLRKVTQLACYLCAALIALKSYVLILVRQSTCAGFRATSGFVGSAASKSYAAPGAFFVQPRRITPTLLRAKHLRLVGISRWVILKILVALRTDRGYFLHCNAFRLSTVSIVIIA